MLSTARGNLLFPSGAHRANKLVDVVHDVVDVVVELLREAHELLRELCGQVESALVEEIVEIFLGDLAQVDANAILVSFLLFLIVRAIVVLRLRLNEAILES